MLEKLEKHLQENFPFLKDQKLLLTISGGIDSVVMAHLFQHLNYSISIAHCNFQLRAEESDKDENFVRKLSKKLNINCHVTIFDTITYCKNQKISTQIGARELRYNWFKKICDEYSYDYILTAHHLNDVMETFFINLSRGTGIDGLTGIPALNKNIVRPLLPFSRKEIEDYASTNNITWREDKSNAETKYIRNKIRHLIVPELYNLHPQFEENFKKTIAHLHQTQEFLDSKIEAIRKNIFVTKEENIYIFKENLNPLQDLEIHKLFHPYGFSSILEIKKLLKAQTGKEISSQTHSLLNNRESIVLYKKTTQESQKTYYIQNTTDVDHLPILLEFSNQKQELNANTISIDPEKNPFPLILRKRKEGDIFNPTGMHGKKKISKYFKDLKLSKIEKENVWLLCNRENDIIWIINYRTDRYLTEHIPKKNSIFIKRL